MLPSSKSGIFLYGTKNVTTQYNKVKMQVSINASYSILIFRITNNN